MILPNVQKFVFDEERFVNFRNIVNKCAGSNNVIFSPHFGTIFSWWTPKTSPNSEEGGWSKLKNVQVIEGNMNNVSLWDSTQATSDISEMIDRHYDCYLVPMDDIHYSAIMGDGVNFKIFVEHDNTFYFTNVTDKPDNFMVKSVAVRTSMNNTYVGSLYRLSTNMLEYHVSSDVDAWTNVDHEMDTTPAYNLWSYPDSIINHDNSTNYSVNSWGDLPSGVRLDLPLEPKTPENRPMHPPENLPTDNLMNKFNGEEIDHVHEYSSGSDIELTSGSEESEESDYEDCDDEEGEEEEDNVVNIAEGIPVDHDETSDEDYEPSDSGDSSDESSDSYDSWDYYEDYYDEMRQDLDGCWYTRRQFYDWYGSDEAWDNLDPNMYHRMRYDENCDQWNTKEEMFQWYGSNIVWKKMNPKKQLKRRRLCDVYSWASYLPKSLRHSFIGDYMRTYNMIDKSSHMKNY